MNEQTGLYVVDERRVHQAARVARFGRRRGGHLDEAALSDNVGPLVYGEQLIAEMLAVRPG